MYGNDSLHCMHGSPIVEKPRFSKESKSTIFRCKPDAKKKETPPLTRMAYGGGEKVGRAKT
jgi:hypothetical protein